MHGFRLEITSLEDFIRFVSVIRGENFDLARLTKELNESTTPLVNAEKEGESNGK